MARPLPAGAIAELEALIERRRNREPVSQILGQWEFWSLPFVVTAATLTPRPDTETLVQAALDLLPDRKAPLRLLDLGTGSGCLLLALLHELPAARGLGVDRSPEALAVAAAQCFGARPGRSRAVRPRRLGRGIERQLRSHRQQSALHPPG